MYVLSSYLFLLLLLLFFFLSPQIHFSNLLGKNIGNEEAISFKGRLSKSKKSNVSEIFGTFNFLHLPKMAQMMPVMASATPVHNDDGIVDGVPLTPDVVMPSCGVTLNEKLATRVGRARTATIGSLSQLRRLSSSVGSLRLSPEDDHTDEVAIQQALKNL
jgi:hypothetical protein